MRMATLWVALLGAAVAGPPAAPAQNVAAPAAEPAQGPIAAIQQQLKSAGYRPGPVNGVMTEQTRRAIAAYERRSGRPPGAPGRPGGEADPVRRVQAGLQRLGLLAGPLDGALGPQTRDAIIRFEAAHRLTIDPRVSDRLLAALDRAGAAAGPSSAPAASAAPSAAPAGGPATPPQTAAPETLGRQPLPPGVTPPPIR